MQPVEGSTVIGKSVSIKGELSGSGELFLDGVFEGTVTLEESRLTIGPNAKVKAEVRVRDLVIFGVVEGNMHVAGRIELRQSANLTGDVVAARMSIEENASIQGHVELAGQGGATEGAAPKA